jgi:hypothetical protein
VELDCGCGQQLKMIATTHRYLAVKLERAELTDIGRFDRWNSCRCQCDRARIDNSSRSAPGTRRGGDDRDEVVVDVTLEVGCFFWRVQKWASDRERQGSCSDPCGTVNQFRGSRTTTCHQGTSWECHHWGPLFDYSLRPPTCTNSEYRVLARHERE